MKKLLCIFLITAFLFAFAGCSNTEKADGSSEQTGKTEEQLIEEFLLRDLRYLFGIGTKEDCRLRNSDAFWEYAPGYFDESWERYQNRINGVTDENMSASAEERVDLAETYGEDYTISVQILKIDKIAVSDYTSNEEAFKRNLPHLDITDIEAICDVTYTWKISGSKDSYESEQMSTRPIFKIGGRWCWQ